ncbi:type II toxin-antitoxin system RelE/ParE family toxin [candidate division KSB1 bacterium]|nr:type II toxin-antitoxin system RelE/ParE family toxin [candidate division KSB1 bacterium]
MNKKYKVIWTNIAEYDLDEIFDYISIDSQRNALLILSKIRAKCDTLKYHPFRCRIIPELKEINILSYRDLILTPYRIMFKVERNIVYILGVFDCRRDLEEILIDRIIR